MATIPIDAARPQVRTFVRFAYSDEEIQSIASQGRACISAWTRVTASQRNVSLRKLPSDAFIKAVSCLSDGVVDLDPVEELLVALGRAGVLSPFQSSLLQAHYLD